MNDRLKYFYCRRRSTADIASPGDSSFSASECVYDKRAYVHTRRCFSPQHHLHPSPPPSHRINTTLTLRTCLLMLLKPPRFLQIKFNHPNGSCNVIILYCIRAGARATKVKVSDYAYDTPHRWYALRCTGGHVHVNR